MTLESMISGVVDTTEGTAISLRRTRLEAEEDAAIATVLYKRCPNGQPTLSAYIPEGVDEQGGFVDLWEPLLSLRDSEAITVSATPSVRIAARVIRSVGAGRQHGPMLLGHA
jgi:hypothetical protein